MPKTKLRGQDLLKARMKNGGELLPWEAPAKADARPKAAKAREALAYLAIVNDWPPSWGCGPADSGPARASYVAADRNAAVVLDLVGATFESELRELAEKLERRTPALQALGAFDKALVVGFAGREAFRGTPTSLLKRRWEARGGDAEGRIHDVMHVLGVPWRERQNWTRDIDVPDDDALFHEFHRAQDRSGRKFMAMLEFRKGAGISRARLYAKHRDWCSINGFPPMSEHAFRTAVELLPSVRRRRFGRRHEEGWSGIGLRKKGDESLRGSTT